MAQDVVSALIPFMDWLRNHKKSFYLDKILKMLDVPQTEKNIAFFRQVIEYNHIAYTHNFDLSGEWYPRNVFCLNLYFAITPTQLEIDNKIIIQGTRFDPYVSNLVNSIEPTIQYRNDLIESSLVSLPLSKIRKYYYLYSDDELMDHLSSITANENHQFPPDPDDNSPFYIPCFDMKKCYEKTQVDENTKFVFQVKDFEQKIIRFVKTTNDDISKECAKEWANEFKKFFLYVASTCEIDHTTIADLITKALFMAKDTVVRSIFLISPQDYLRENDLLQDVRTGVRDARWIKGTSFSPYNSWFHHVFNFQHLIFRMNADESFFATINSPITEGMICFYVLEFAENNYIAVSQEVAECKNECIKAFINDFFNLECYKPYHKRIASIMKRKYKRYINSFNPFNKKIEVDVAISLLKVFKRLVLSVHHLKRLGIGPKDIPIDISIVIQQMVQDMEYAARNLMKLMDKEFFHYKDRTVSALQELIEKFEIIVDETEQFVFSRYERS